MLMTAEIATPAGDMIAACDANALHLLEFSDRRALPREAARLEAAGLGPLTPGRTAVTDRIEAELADYFAGRLTAFATPLVMHGTAFQQAVWRALLDIPYGETRSYAELAQAVAKPTAARAVARANGANQIAIVIPCHRVIGADGALTGYGGGLKRKQALLELEGAFDAGGLFAARAARA